MKEYHVQSLGTRRITEFREPGVKEAGLGSSVHQADPEANLGLSLGCELRAGPASYALYRGCWRQESEQN